ncbi:hypothetical protein [Erythrobacter sp. MTPC3]|uniref:hypothetical protein n=1 Tax=Erythrobacter sp. MTPC3 TaxID=3056564 RepID=UPI0036F410C3
MSATIYTVGFYEIDRAFGGPEEGGWWFDTGTLIRLHSVHRNDNAAWAVANRANRLLERLQRGKRGVDSVIYEGGQYRAFVFADVPPAHFPATAPTYS